MNASKGKNVIGRLSWALVIFTVLSLFGCTSDPMTTPALYEQIRETYRTERHIDPAAYRKYGSYLRNRARSMTEHADYAACDFTGYEITSCYPVATLSDAENTYAVYRWEAVYILRDPASAAVYFSDTMHLDADGNLAGYGEVPYFSIRNPDSSRWLFQFLPEDLFSGDTEEEQNAHAIACMQELYARMDRYTDPAE